MQAGYRALLVLLAVCDAKRHGKRHGKATPAEAKPSPLPGPPASAHTAEVDAAASLGEDLSCHARAGYDLSGDAAYVWGLVFHVPTAADCCKACAAHHRPASTTKKFSPSSPFVMMLC